MFSCDIDEVNAKHIDADLIIHYGESSLSQSASIPTIHVFGRHPKKIDEDAVCRSFHDTFPKKSNTRIVFLHHVTCNYIAGKNTISSRERCPLAVIFLVFGLLHCPFVLVNFDFHLHGFSLLLDKITDRLMPEYPYLSVGEINFPKQPGKAKEEDSNILKDLCTKSCPGCPCRLNTEDKEGKAESLSETSQSDKKDKTNIPITNTTSVDSHSESNEAHHREEEADEQSRDLKKTQREDERNHHQPDCKVSCFSDENMTKTKNGYLI